MKSVFTFVVAAFLATLLAGCTSNTVVVIAPQDVKAQARLLARKKAAEPCFLSVDARAKYIAAVPVLVAPSGAIPQKAKDEHIDGCAGVEFQLDQDGHPINLNTVKETPVGYGFADMLLQRLTKDTFKPSANAGQWYYVSTAYISSTMTSN